MDTSNIYAAIVFASLVTSLTVAATININNVTGGSLLEGDTSSFQPQHIDFTLWNVNEEQFSKNYVEKEPPTKEKPIEYKTIFWTITSVVGNKPGRNETTQKPESAVETLKGINGTKNGNLTSVLIDEKSSDKIERNSTVYVDEKLTQNDTNLDHKKNDEINTALQGEETYDNYSSESVPHNSTGEFLLDLEGIDTKSTSFRDEIDFETTESEDIVLSGISFDEVDETLGLQDQFELVVNTTSFIGAEGPSTIENDILIEHLNTTRQRKEYVFEVNNTTSENESKILGEENSEDLDIELYSRSSKYFGKIEKILNEDSYNETQFDDQSDIAEFDHTDDHITNDIDVQSNIAEFDQTDDNITNDIDVFGEDTLQNYWQTKETKDEELIPERNYESIDQEEIDVTTGSNFSGSANDVGLRIDLVGGPKIETYNSTRFTSSKNPTIEREPNIIEEEFENSTISGDELEIEGDSTKNETGSNNIPPDLSEENDKQNSSERIKDGGRSFDVNRTKSDLLVPDDSINDIDSKDHDKGTTVVFDIFGYVNSTWYLVQKFAESTTRPYEPSFSTPTTQITEVSDKTEIPTEIHTDFVTPFQERENSTFERDETLEFDESENIQTSTDAFEVDLQSETTGGVPTETSSWSLEDFSDFRTTDEEEHSSQSPAPLPVSTTTEADYDDGNIITLLKHLRLSLLSDLLKRTGLDQEFSKSNQSVTIFAPTDEAFNSLSPNTIRKFQKDSKLLKNLILHHIVDWEISAKDFENELTLDSLAQIPTERDIDLPQVKKEPHDTGSRRNIPLKLNLYQKKGATINGARFILADIRGTNGIIHVITKVLYRFARYDLISSLKRCSRFSTMLKVAEKAGINLKDGPYTIFAPVNEAWENDIISNLTTTKAKEIFNSHVVEGSRFSSGLSDEEEVDTLKRYWTIKVGIRNGELKEVNRARVIMSDVPVTDGVIHVIDRTLYETKLCDDFF